MTFYLKQTKLQQYIRNATYVYWLHSAAFTLLFAIGSLVIVMLCTTKDTKGYIFLKFPLGNKIYIISERDSYRNGYT